MTAIEPASSPSGSRAGAALRAGLEVAGAVLVALVAVVVSLNVICRYVFHAPLAWGDELAGALFIWLSMIGAALALDRQEHMQLTMVLKSAPPRLRDWLRAAGLVLVLVFLLALVQPVYEHVDSQRFVNMPMLGLSDGYRAAALAAGIVLMAASVLVRLWAGLDWRRVAGVIVILALLAGLLWWARPLILQMGNLNLLVFFVAILSASILIGVPIAFSIGLATILYVAIATRAPLVIVAAMADDGMSNPVLLAIPLFIFLGYLIEMAGLARALVDFMASLLGHVRNGLAYVLLGAMFLVSGISGSKAADMAAIAPGLVPEMKRLGYQPGDLAALLAASCVMTETIPPSLVLILIGSVTGVSIGALFVGGLIPAVVCTAALCIVIALKPRSHAPVARRGVDWRVVRASFWTALPALALPVLIRTAVTEGVATATEVASVGILYAFVIGPTLYREFRWRRVYPVLVETASLTGAVMLIFGTAAAMAWALTQSGFSHQLVAAMRGMPGGSLGFLAVSIAALVVLGSFLEGLPAILVFAPLLFPVAKAVGLNEVHYAIVIIIAMGIGLFAPPFGVGFYGACAIAGVPPDQAMRRIWPYLAVLLAALCVIALVPQLTTGLL